MLLTRCFGGLRAFRVPDTRPESTASVDALPATAEERGAEKKESADQTAA